MTNNLIIESYKVEHNITCPLHTYAKWRELGYQVRKGEKSKHQITIWKGYNKTRFDEESNTEIITNKVIMKTAHFFTLEQVERIAQR